MIFFGESSLRNAVKEFVAHYHAERNHQSFQNRIIEPEAEVGTKAGSLECRERLGGMLNHHFCKAA
jgi:hypothetical protein